MESLFRILSDVYPAIWAIKQRPRTLRHTVAAV